MPDSLDKQEIGSSWTNLNTLTGIAAGSAIVVQNVGAKNGAIANVGTPNAVIEVTTSSSQPAESFSGWNISFNEQWKVSAGEEATWVRFRRLGKSDVGSNTCYVKVMSI